MGFAKCKIVNSKIFVQNVKVSKKSTSDRKQLIELKGKYKIVTPIIPGALKYILIDYHNTIADYLVSGFKDVLTYIIRVLNVLDYPKKLQSALQS